MNLKKQNRKGYDLKNLGILSNSEQNNISNYLNKREQEYKIIPQKWYNSPIKIIKNNEDKNQSEKKNNNKEKIKNIINNKAIINSLTNNYFFPKKNYYSYSKIKLNMILKKKKL